MVFINKLAKKQNWKTLYLIFCKHIENTHFCVHPYRFIRLFVHTKKHLLVT